MARDGSGTYSLPATMATANAVAASATVNSIMDDVAQALTDSINKDGSKAFAANQSMGGFKLTNLAAATTANDAPRMSQAQSGVAQQATTVGGTVDAITLAFTPAIAAYATGQRIRWTSAGANTVTAPTVNVDSLGAKTIKKNPGGAALAASDIGASGTICEAVYNGTDFILLNPAAASAASASDTVQGIVELATTTETLTGSDTARAVTPDALAALWEQGADIASAGTIAIGEGGYFNITGTTTITDIDPSTDKAGRVFRLKFAGALTLTHSGTTLILPGGANITTAAGDIAEFVSEGTDVVRCVSYQKASGLPVVSPSAGGVTLLGTLTTTSGSEQGLTSLTLTDYKFLLLVLVGVSGSAAGATNFRVSQSSGSGQVTVAASAANANTMRGTCWIDLTDGTFSATAASAGAAASAVATSYAGDTNLTTASTAVYFSGDNTLDAGSVRVYGVA